MKRGKKRPQLRRCTYCDRVGHNRATCADFLASFENTAPMEDALPAVDNPVIEQAPLPPMKGAINFFIHHVNADQSPSPFVVNLKQPKTNIWENVQSDEPFEINDDFFHNYHKNKQQAQPIIPAAIENKVLNETTQPRPVVAREITQTKESKKEREEIFIVPENLAKTKKKEVAADIQPVKQSVKKSPVQPKSSKFFLFDAHYWDRAVRQFAADIRQFIFGRKVVITACLLAFVLIVPARANTYFHSIKLTADEVSDNSTAGFMALQDSTSALMNSNLPQAQESLNNALQKFGSATEILNSKHQLLQKIVGSVPFVASEVESRQNLLSAGQKIAIGNAYLLKGLAENQSDISTTTPLTERATMIATHLKAALPNYEQALQDLSAVKTDVLPLEYQAPFNDFKILFAGLINDLNNLVDLSASIQEIFGGEGLRRYIIVFQNPHELRPTGGFMGSFAVMEMEDGKITKFFVPPGGSYDLQGQLSEYVEPPAPLLLSNKRWEFQDANWFPDFPASAQKTLWFYRKSRQMTADGVIAINAEVLNRLLAIIGPVTDEKRQVTLTAANAIPAIQQIVEEGPEKKDGKPKQIIADLATEFIEYFQNIQAKDLMPVLVGLQDSLEAKDIQAYFTDSHAEGVIKSFGWGGKIITTNELQDYLFVVNTNIQGQKTDAEIKQTISHQALVQEDGTVLDNVTITREHRGTNGEKLYGQTNIDYIRIYVPEGSELLSAGGFSWPDENKFRVPDKWTKKDTMLANLEKEIKIDEKTGTRITSEFGKTAFGNWAITEPGQTSQVQFIYRLPFKVFTLKPVSDDQWKKIFNADISTARYQLVLQRQSGCESSFEHQIIFPEGWQPYWKDGAELSLAANGASIASIPLTKDTVWSLMMTKEQ